MSDTFTCAYCGGTFQRRPEWTDEDALAEAKEFFGYDVPKAEQEVLCDDCYTKFKAWVETLTPEERAAIDREVRGHA